MNVGDGGAPLVIGGNSAPKAPATSNVPGNRTAGNRPPPSSKPGPLAQAISRGVQRMIKDQGPLEKYRSTILHPGKYAGVTPGSPKYNPTIGNLASNYGQRTVIPYTPPTHQTHQTQTAAANIPQFNTNNATDRAGDFIPHPTLAQLAPPRPTVSPAHPGPVGGLHAILSSQIHSGGGIPGSGGASSPGIGGSGGGAGNSAPAGGTSLNDFLAQARQLIGAQYAPQLGDLAGQFQQDQDVFNQQRNNTNADAARMGNNLQQIYAALQGQLGGQADQLGQHYQGAEQNVGNVYQQLQQQLAGDQFGSQDLRALFQGLGQVGGTNANALLQSEGANQTGLLKTEAANAPLEGANRISQVDVQAVQTLRNLSDNLENQLNAIQSKRVNINSAEGQQTAALAQKLMEQKQAADAALQVKEQSMGLQQQKLDLSKSLGFGKLGIDQQNADTRTQAEKDKVAENNILNQLRAQGLSLQAQKAAKSTNTKNPSGLLGMTTVAQQDSPQHSGDMLGFFFNNPTITAALYNGPTGATTVGSQAQAWAKANAGRLGMNPSQLYNDLMTMAATFSNKLGNS